MLMIFRAQLAWCGSMTKQIEEKVPWREGAGIGKHAGGLASGAGRMLLLLAMAGSVAQAQTGTDKGSFINHVAGNCYDRRVVEPDGRVTGHQRVRVNESVPESRGAVIPIDVINFRTGGSSEDELQVEDRYEFKMAGDITSDAQEEAALQIIGYLDGNRRVSVEFLDQTVIYPAEPCEGGSLSPVRLNLSAEGGLVDLLGGRAEIRIVERNCRSTGDADGYVIEGKLHLAAYLLGIRFKKERYHSHQRIGADRRLVRHALEDPDGGRQELTMMDLEACRPPWD